MLFSKLFLSLRYVLGDVAGNVYSDYQLEEAVNTVQSIIANSLATSNSELLTETATITLTSNVGDLPANYQSTVSVFNASNKPLSYLNKSKPIDEFSYRIRGKKIYSAAGTLTLDYKKSLTNADIADLNIVMDLPDYFADTLKKYAVMILQNGMNKADAPIIQLITDDVYKLTSGREYSGIEITPAFSF
jgi:hypothetical protein